MKMAYALAMCLLTGSGFSAAAAAAGNQCQMIDWGYIRAALEQPASEGEDLRASVASLVNEENGMALDCQKFSLNISGIPGTKYLKYYVASGDRKYILNITIGGVEEPGLFNLEILKAQ